MRCIPYPIQFSLYPLRGLLCSLLSSSIPSWGCLTGSVPLLCSWHPSPSSLPERWASSEELAWPAVREARALDRDGALPFTAHARSHPFGDCLLSLLLFAASPFAAGLCRRGAGAGCLRRVLRAARRRDGFLGGMGFCPWPRFARQSRFPGFPFAVSFLPPTSSAACRLLSLGGGYFFIAELVRLIRVRDFQAECFVPHSQASGCRWWALLSSYLYSGLCSQGHIAHRTIVDDIHVPRRWLHQLIPLCATQQVHHIHLAGRRTASPVRAKVQDSSWTMDRLRRRQKERVPTLGNRTPCPPLDRTSACLWRARETVASGSFGQAPPASAWASKPNSTRRHSCFTSTRPRLEWVLRALEK